MDGLFQDVAATQIASLTLNPNAPNGSALDALQQSFQLQLQYSATAGIQNGLAAQQSSVASNYAVYQNQLLQQQSQLLTAQVTAQKQLGDAQKALDSLTTPTADQQAAAKQQVTVANDNLMSIGSQLTDVQNSLSKTLTVSPTFNTNSITPTPPSSPPALPTVQPALPSGPAGFSPNFPATKQMDNQITLLWERLARLVETLNQGNDPNDTLYLVEFDTNIMPRDRKHQMLNIRFPMGCASGGQDARPYVVDMYPRNAAVNVMNEKYRETRVGLAALMSFFRFGLNASYNRDHLQISQVLSQSSYITGYGVGESTVGWLYGISLGDDAIAPGVRSVYALIAVPQGCGTGRIYPPVVTWTKSPAMTTPTDPTWEERRREESAVVTTVAWSGSKDFPVPSNSSHTRCNPLPGCVSKIMFSPVQVDSSTTTAPVMVTVSLDPTKATLDKEEVINVNGRYLLRARDTFGRAVNGTGITGSGGILETGSLAANTWLPLSSTTFVMNLDGILFPSRFPNILLQSPNGVIDLTNSFVKPAPDGSYPGATVVIDGVNWDCNGDCSSILPSLTRPKQTNRIAILRWAASYQDKNGELLDQLCITIADSAGVSPSTTPATGNTPLQVIKDGGLSVWGSRTIVLLDQGGDVAPIVAGGCKANGARLLCPVGQAWRDRNLVIKVLDPDHAGAYFVGAGSLQGCLDDGECSNPFVWDSPPPLWNDPDNPDSGANVAWTLRLTMANLQHGDTAVLSNDRKLSLSAAPLDCTDLSRPCEVRFTIPRGKLDSVTATTRLRVSGQDGKARGTPSLLALLPFISPLVTAIDPTQTDLKGSNLVFDTIQIGTGGKPISMTCNAEVDASHCSITKYDPDAKGFLYFVIPATPASLFPVISSADGKQVLHDPTAIKAAAGQGKPVTTAAVGAQQAGAVATPPPPQAKQNVPVTQPQ